MIIQKGKQKYSGLIQEMILLSYPAVACAPIAVFAKNWNRNKTGGTKKTVPDYFLINITQI
jgi:hypothetical protein